MLRSGNVCWRFSCVSTAAYAQSSLACLTVLRNDEVQFVSKNPQGTSVLFPPKFYQLRADKKVYAALFDGTLDSTPLFDEAKLSEVFSK